MSNLTNYLPMTSMFMASYHLYKLATAKQFATFMAGIGTVVDILQMTSIEPKSKKNTKHSKSIFSI